MALNINIFTRKDCSKFIFCDFAILINIHSFKYHSNVILFLNDCLLHATGNKLSVINCSTAVSVNLRQYFIYLLHSRLIFLLINCLFNFIYCQNTITININRFKYFSKLSDITFIYLSSNHHDSYFL